MQLCMATLGWQAGLTRYLPGSSVKDLSAIDEDTIPLRLLSTGRLEWSPPSILTVSCGTDITYFPFDIQTCRISMS